MTFGLCPSISHRSGIESIQRVGVYQIDPGRFGVFRQQATAQLTFRRVRLH